MLLGCVGPPLGMILIVLFFVFLLSARLFLAAGQIFGSIFQAIRPDPIQGEPKLGRGA